MEAISLDLDGQPVLVRSTGNGPVLVLLHGFGEDGRVWETLAQQLTGCRVLVPDLPGSGRSKARADQSMEGMARTLAACLEQMEVDTCILVGHSMGGYVALAFLELFPHKVRALGLFHSSTFADSEEKKATRRKGIAFIHQHGAAKFLETTTPNMFAPATQNERPELVASQVAALKDADSAALIAYYEAMMQRPDRTYLLRQNKIPYLFVLGKHDAAVPVGDSLQQVHLPDHSLVYLLEGSGHMGMLEEPEQSRNLLQHFINSVTE